MKRHLALVLLLALFGFSPWLLSAPPEKTAPADGFKQVPRRELEVTDGKIGEKPDGTLTIDSPEVRAIEKATGAKAARLTFTYHGPTKEEAKLASGKVARQIGLKLRAKNTCNLLYIMWKLDDKERIAVSVKRNPGQSTHKECIANGYVSIKPAFQEKQDKFPTAKDGKPHTLEANVAKRAADRYELTVRADGKIVWQGPIEAKLLDDIDGPAGLRTDNGVFTFKLFSLAP
jgi:hypothetical protein